ncbi:MAG TPA: hypothetical protein VD963_10060 [Phycisphaerales bacterium]|nr:hypothetical protein [Phycisphaerales bacterium]
MLDALKPGQTIRCTVTKVPRTDDAQQTIMRLMRRDPVVKRGLKKAQRRRGQELNVYNRGNRDWTSRERVGKIVRVAPGASWTMPYTLDVAPDLRAVDGWLEVAPA